MAAPVPLFPLMEMKKLSARLSDHDLREVTRSVALGCVPEVPDGDRILFACALVATALFQREIDAANARAEELEARLSALEAIEVRRRATRVTTEYERDKDGEIIRSVANAG